jgi:hypothetical protein
VFPWAGAALRERAWSGAGRQAAAHLPRAVEQRAGRAPLEHALIVANHISWLDIFVINSPAPLPLRGQGRDPRLAGARLAGRQAGTVFIARGNRRDLRHIFKGLVHAWPSAASAWPSSRKGPRPARAACCRSTPTCSRPRSTPGAGAAVALAYPRRTPARGIRRSTTRAR